MKGAGGTKRDHVPPSFYIGGTVGPVWSVEYNRFDCLPNKRTSGRHSGHFLKAEHHDNEFLHSNSVAVVRINCFFKNYTRYNKWNFSEIAIIAN